MNGSTDRIGTFGIWTFDFEHQPAAQVRESAQELEEQGWQAIWVPELLGREALTHAGFLLASTERMTVFTGITTIWSREAQWTHGGALLLADAYPGRHVLGLGVGNSRPGVKPLAALEAYLDELDGFQTPNPAPTTPVRRILAAYGPKMLGLARDRADGAHTYHVNVAHTASAREILGPQPFLGVEQAVLFETEPTKAREIARAHLELYLGSKFNRAKFRRFGYTEDDLDDGGSDRFVDDLVVWGDLDTITAKLRRHVEAGADHVGIQVIGVDPGQSAMPHWRRLGEALLD
ncbi:TIGR03620 family F420-dependent LLM class oxidoreductase [Amycolatopsis sp.]|uniref:TIGR03620 family F420-dependent LLM class oxidoreductase n=1 Tax=Amycolatopsis sp. TaxID=37632 RepID=UPI002CC74A12|nr:TIGR03620 family F420-dependent LLM class oxidoreductase [Amycolatopsis sp.]HVV13545.1 TIGR03620 family F420-dependent LLM class oxidoreductase [Amycolatopsis sp.]